MSTASTKVVSFDDVQHAFHEFKNTLDKSDQGSAETKEKVAKIEKDFDAYELKNQAMVKELEEAKKARKEQEEKLITLETIISRLPGGKSASTEQVEMKKAFSVFIRKNPESKTADDNALQLKYLRTDNDPNGGFLCPPEYYEEILKKITEVSPIRNYARILQTSRESLLIPVRENIVTGTWVGEGQTYSTNNSNYGLREIKVNNLSVTTISTQQMLMDSVFNVEQQIADDIAESFAATEGRAFVTGSGVGQPQGILTGAGTASGIEVINSEIANSYNADSLIDVTGQLKVGYDPKWFINRRELAFIRKLKDGVGQYLWFPGIAAGQPSQILGYDYVETIDVPDQGVDTTPVIFGDLARGYVIVDNVNLSMIRDPFSQGGAGKVAFYALRRVGGMVVLPEAIKALKCAVSA